MTGISRRQLIGGAALGAVGAAGFVFYIKSEVQDDRVVVLRRYLRSLHDLGTLGSSYIAQVPHAHAEALGDAIFSVEHGELAAPTKISYRDLKTFLKRKVKADFAAQRVIRLDGWMVSTTEAQLSALVAMWY